MTTFIIVWLTALTAFVIFFYMDAVPILRRLIHDVIDIKGKLRQRS